MEIVFSEVKSGEKFKVPVTRPDLLFGCTFISISSERETFTGKYVSNPINGEKIPVYLSSKTAIGVPAHNQEDFDFAKRHNLPVRIVVEPITGKLQENPEFRRSIVALVRDPKTRKIISINWGPSAGGNLLVGGGLNDGEDPVECAKREIAEETGYQDVNFISKSETIHHHYFAHSKNKARQIDAVGLHFELLSDKRAAAQLEEDEKNKFTVEWLTEEEADSRINDELHKYVFNKFVKKLVYTGDGILTNSGEFTGMNSKEAREKIESMLK